MEDVEEIVQFAKKAMLEDDYHAPMVFVKGSTGKVIVALESFGNDADKRVTDMLNAGAFTAIKRNVGILELIVFVNEAWMSKNIHPSSDPKRVEVLLINSLNTATQEQQLIMFEVVRNKQEKVIDLKQKSIPDNGSIEGKLLPAFQKGYQIISPVTN